MEPSTSSIYRFGSEAAAGRRRDHLSAGARAGAPGSGPSATAVRQAAPVRLRPLPPPGRSWAQRPGRGRPLAAAPKHKPSGRGSEGRCAAALEAQGQEGASVQAGLCGEPDGGARRLGFPPPPERSEAPMGHLPQPARQGTGPACGWSSMASHQARWSSYGGWEGSPRSAQSQRAGSVWAPPVQLSPQVLMASPRPARPTGPAPQTCLASYLAPGPHGLCSGLCSGCWAAGTFPQTTWPFTTGPLTTGPQSHVGPGTPAISLSIRAR